MNMEPIMEPIMALFGRGKVAAQAQPGVEPKAGPEVPRRDCGCSKGAEARAKARAARGIKD